MKLRWSLRWRKVRRIGGIKLNKLNTIKILLIFVMVLCVLLISNVKKSKSVSFSVEDIQAFRIPSETLINLKNLTYRYEMSFSEALAVYSISNNFFPKKTVPETYERIEKNFIYNYENIKNRIDKKTLDKYKALFDSFIYEIAEFPIPLAEAGGARYNYIYGDTWGDGRTYGGDRIHLGTDIMDRENISGQIPIVSITSGKVEKLGWNEKGGWRVGIRSENGNYYYYAHLDKYSEALKEGVSVLPGEFLGYMGDSGYGKKEGTKGNFAVHLHMGICVKTNLTEDEFWINPFPFLRTVENSIKN